eukprot:scpid82555/ scgid20583/ Histone deacetylase 11
MATVEPTSATATSACAGAQASTFGRLYRSGEDFSTRWPIVYSSVYNIGFLGMEKLHPFDSKKWGRVFAMIQEEKMISGEEDIVTPVEAHEDDLRQIHTNAYLSSLSWSANVARITEIAPVAIVPNFIVNRVVLKPLRFQTGGTVLAGRLAMEHGWSINIGGGFHHCSGEEGGGFCAYADISLCIKALQENYFADDENKNILIVDLDAHQGNGHENDVRTGRISHVTIMDMYNSSIYPRDRLAAKVINEERRLEMYTEDDTYLRLLRRSIACVLDADPPPRALIYNAGTDVLEGDQLGRLAITDQGIIDRDEIVFRAATERRIPIVMVTSGGYQVSGRLSCTGTLAGKKTL